MQQLTTGEGHFVDQNHHINTFTFKMEILKRKDSYLFKHAYKHGIFDEEVDGPLHWALQNGCIEAALYMIKEGEDTNRLDSIRRSPLKVALVKNYLDVFKALVENKADVNFVGANNQSLLFRAIEEGKLQYAEVLINSGANVKLGITTSNNFTPLHAAAWYGATHIAKLLIMNGAEINAKTTNHQKTPLFLASHKGHQEIVEILINMRANQTPLLAAEINAKTIALESPLHAASCKGHQEIVKILLENGAEHNIKDTQKNEPIHYASDKGHIQCLETLIQNGAYFDAEGEDGMTSLQMAIYENHTAIAQMLLNCGANSNVKDNLGISPMEQAITKKALKSFKLLAFFN